MKPSTFRVLMVWIDGWSAFADAELEEELLPEQIALLGQAGASRRKGFLLLARRNWELEYQARRVRMPAIAQGLFKLPDGQAVDRLVGYQDDAGRWRPGLAGLEPREAEILRRRVCDRWAIWEICAELKLSRSAADKHLSEARRKLRSFLGLREGKIPASGSPVPIEALAPLS